MVNWNIIEGNWKEFAGKVQERWGKLTNDDLDIIIGKYDQLVGKIQERYGGKDEITEGEIKRSLDEWLENLKTAKSSDLEKA
jgi:uncharacterized protein YjbJ (UPF0337 family)